MLVVDALYDSYKSSDEDITTYVSACTESSQIYDKYPKQVKDGKIWNGVIVQDKNCIFHIDLKSVVFKQL